MKQEKSIEKIRKRFHRGCAEYNLLEDGDKILVAISGGKDSLTLCRLMAERSRLYKPKIHVEAAHVIMDNIPYKTDQSYLQTYCDNLSIPLHILHTSFDQSTDKRKTRCFLCSWNRRKTLLTYATENHFNKIALGHHMDDILVTFLMNITFEGSIQTMPPRLTLQHYPLTFIRPLCLVAESDILEFAETEKLPRQKVPCPYEQTTRRADMSHLLHHLEHLNPEARYSLWNSVHNIHPDLLP